MTRKEQVLRYVNRLREKYDIGPALPELPKGYCESPYDCPLAHALHAMSVQPDRIMLDAGLDDFIDIEPPAYVKSFINGFDHKRYPELIEAS